MAFIPRKLLSAAELSEELMCLQILEYAREFYKDPKNKEAFEKWVADGKPYPTLNLREPKLNKRNSF